jgi:HD domain
VLHVRHRREGVIADEEDHCSRCCPGWLACRCCGRWRRIDSLPVNPEVSNEPIHTAETLRTLVLIDMEPIRERSARLTTVALVLGACSLALLIGLGLTTDAPDLIEVAVFGALFALAANSDVEGPKGTSISAGFTIVVAAMIVFATRNTPVGVVLVGIIGALIVRHIVHGEWQKILCNAGAHGISMTVGVAVLLALPESWLHDFPRLLGAATLAALANFVVNACVVGLAVAYFQSRPARDVLRALFQWQWQLYPFALVGIGFAWLELHEGPAVLALAITPVLVGRQAFLSYVRVHDAHEATLHTLVQALESKDHYTAGHAERVAAYANVIGEDLGLGFKELERLRAAALMHDIGKLVVPNQLLHKPDRLTAAEYEVVRRHEEVTVELLGRIDFLAPVAPIAIGVYGPWHDDHGRDPIDRHIVAVADAYDAMTSTRSYRKALSQEVAFAELRANAGTQLHPTCVEALINGVERRGLHHGEGYEAPEALERWDTEPPVAGPGSAGLGDLAEQTAL